MGLIQSLVFTNRKALNAAMRGLMPHPDTLPPEGFNRAADVFIESIRNGSIPLESDTFSAFAAFLSHYKNASQAAALVNDTSQAYASGTPRTPELKSWSFGRFKRDFASQNISAWLSSNDTDLWLLDLNTRWSDSLSSKSTEERLVDIKQALSKDSSASNMYKIARINAWLDARKNLCSLDSMRQLILLANYSTKLRLFDSTGCQPVTLTHQDLEISSLPLLRALEIPNRQLILSNKSVVEDFKFAISTGSLPTPGKTTWKFKPIADDIGQSQLIGRSDDQKGVVSALKKFRTLTNLKCAVLFLFQLRYLENFDDLQLFKDSSLFDPVEWKILSSACSYAGACNLLHCTLGHGKCKPPDQSNISEFLNLTDEQVSAKLLKSHVQHLKSPIFDATSILTRFTESGNLSLIQRVWNFHDQENGLVEAREFLTSPNSELPKNAHFVISLLSQLSGEERFDLKISPEKWALIAKQCENYDAEKSGCLEIITGSCEPGASRKADYKCACNPGFIKTWKFNPLGTRIGGCVSKWGAAAILAGTAALAITAAPKISAKFSDDVKIRILTVEYAKRKRRRLIAAIIFMTLLVIVLAYFVYRRS